MFDYTSVDEIVLAASKSGKSISELVIADQAEQTMQTVEELYKQMRANFNVMKDAIKSGLNPKTKSQSGLTGGDAYKLISASESGITIGGKLLGKILANALAVAEVNACMGKIVAAPTAGSCGIIPAVLFTIMQEHDIPEEKVIMSMFTSAGIGMVIAKKASLSGAEGGCQAECGSASAMAAAALVELGGGTPAQSAHAAAIALKNVLGLVCDPVAGLVEVPCIKRNAMGAANALISADMALSGIESKIPVDEVIIAMKNVGNLMSPALKETAEAGLAGTPTGKKLASEIFGE